MTLTEGPPELVQGVLVLLVQVHVVPQQLHKNLFAVLVQRCQRKLQTSGSQRSKVRDAAWPWRTATVSHLHASVAVFRGQDEAGQVRGQVQAAEVPHQVPEDDGVLAEELVGVDDLQGATESQKAANALPPGVGRGDGGQRSSPDLLHSPARSPALSAAPAG